MGKESLNETIRIAHIMGKWGCGGVESFVMNYYRNIDRSKVQFDFLIDEDSNYIPREEIEQMGGKVIIIPPYQKIFKYIKTLIRVFKENDYKIVHSNLNTLSVFPLFSAKLAGVPVRIAHSHSTSNKKEWKKNLLKNILRPFSKLFATDYFACTEHAGRWLFGNKAFDDGKVTIINNAIDVDKFKYSEDIRNKLRKQLNIENKLVIGHVGRFMEQKNHEFLIDVFYEVHKEKKESVLLLIGDGHLENKIKEKVRNLELQDAVIFLGVKNNVNEYMQAMDVFVFPSLYEGLGIVLIEAQCSGLKCVTSTEVPLNAKISDDIFFIQLDNNLDQWKNSIISTTDNDFRKLKYENAKKFGFDIKEEAEKLMLKYISIMK